MARVKKCWVTAPDELFGAIKATARSCPGIYKAIGRMGGCVPEISLDEGAFTIIGCDDRLDQDPITFCPWCGGRLTLETGKTNG